MTLTITLTDEQAHRLREKARKQHKQDWEYLRDLALLETEPEEWMQKLHRIGVDAGVSLPDEATRRENLYED